jgi:queuine tRNA-ribosyltransferase
VRSDPARLRFEISARDGEARTGVLQTPHGPVETPAFVPLATKGSVRGLTSREVDGLGYQMVLGNTFHLLAAPGPDLIERAGGLHGFMNWDGAIITDSGGFQVFSLAHGGVADEIKGRRGEMPGSGAKVEITERGVSFRSLSDGSEQFIGPEESMEIQAKLGSDIALVFDECTPFHADRDYTAHSMERTNRWLDRCLTWHLENGPAGQAVYGIVQGGIYEDLRRESVEYICASGVDGVAIGGSLGKEKSQMYEVVGITTALLPPEAPCHLLGIGEVDDVLEAVSRGVDTLDCAVPTRLARHGTALAPEPESRFRLDLRRARYTTDEGPLVEGCPCEACTDHSRLYLAHLVRGEDLTAVKLLTIHNLTFMEQLGSAARTAIADGRYEDFKRSILSGASPWETEG